MPTTAKVKVNEIEAISQQPRKQVGDVSDLVQDIRQTGRFYSAVTLERTPQGSLRVISGSRRLKAAQEAELAVVPAIIYEPDEMDAVTRLRMQIGENTTRQPLSAMETALSYHELKVRMDCMYLSDQLGVAMPEADDLAGWEAAYAALLKQAEGKKLARVDESWAEFEQYSGLSRDTRVLYMRLLKLHPDVQTRLIGSDLSLRHQLALGDAPPPVQGELLTAVTDNPGDIPPLKVVQAAARVLAALGEQRPPATQVLATTRRRLGSDPGLAVDALKQAVKQELGGPPPATASLTPRSNDQPDEIRHGSHSNQDFSSAGADEGERSAAPAATTELPASAGEQVDPLAAESQPMPLPTSLRPELMSAEEAEAIRRGKQPPVRELSAEGREFQRITQAAQERLNQHMAALLRDGQVADLNELLTGWGNWLGQARLQLEAAARHEARQGTEAG